MESPLMQSIISVGNRTKIILKSEQKGITPVDIKRACDPEYWKMIWLMLEARCLKFPPERKQRIPKDERDEQGNMKYRVVKIGKSDERIIAPLFNNAMFETFPNHISEHSRAYQMGESCAKIAKEVANQLATYALLTDEEIVAVKFDFSKFFDNVTREAIMELFDELERELGFEHETEPVLNCLRDMFNDDRIIDFNGELVEEWSGIRQGMAVSAFLANAIVQELDIYLSKKYYYYVRYSDDLIVLGGNVEELTEEINSIVGKYGISLNAKKTQPVKRSEFFKFLGFSISGDGEKISPSESRIKKFQNMIWDVTIKKRANGVQARNNILRMMYKGNGEYSWATSILDAINVEEDFDKLNLFVMDTIRCCAIGRWKPSDIGGLGYNSNCSGGAIIRGTGKAVELARKKTEKWIDGYFSVRHMKKLMIDKDAYDMRVKAM